MSALGLALRAARIWSTSFTMGYFRDYLGADQFIDALDFNAGVFRGKILERLLKLLLAVGEEALEVRNLKDGILTVLKQQKLVLDVVRPVVRGIASSHGICPS